MATEHQEFVARFMADYFAECEEHLVEVRASLLALEPRMGSAEPAVPVLDELFRNFHSLKGISAIAEMRDGERLAHEMEDYLRVLRIGEAALSPAGLDALVDGTNTFERILDARRAGHRAPSIEATLDQLARVTRLRTAAAPPDDARSPLPVPAGSRWTVTFTPSAALVARGIKVDTIRDRLQGIGAVESAVPRVLDAGRIAFDFIVATGDDEALRSWSADGVTYEPAPSARAADAGEDAPAASSDEDAALSQAAFVRVDLARLDDLMRHVGDMVVTRSRMKDALQRIERVVPAAEWRLLVDHSERLERQLRSVREGVMRVRMVSVAEIFRRMPFVVRDLARHAGKEVRIHLTGQETEVDKLLVERMADPVLHLVRNAVSHGIESPAERAAAGKPPGGTVRLSAATVGASVVLEVSDDGRGLDGAAIAARAQTLGLGPADGMTDARQLLDVICAPGFSTRDEADRASGRGVGMAVARRTIHDLGGTLEMETEFGVGTTFRMTLPLTLAIAEALLVSVGDHTFAVPQTTVREAIEVPEDALTVIEANELMVHRGSTLPLVRLGRLFGLPSAPRPRMHALVIGTGAAAFGLLVDRIAGQREIVVKTITDPLIRVGGVTAVTELGDGRVVLILDVPWLGGQLRGPAPAARAPGYGGVQ